MTTKISNRDRFKSIARGQRPGDIMIIDWFHRCLAETPAIWMEQGAPRDIIYGSTFSGAKIDAMSEYFGYDRLHALREIVSGMHRLALFEKTDAESFYPTPPIVPAFGIKMLNEDERSRVETTFGGQTVRVSKEFPWRMPTYLDHQLRTGYLGINTNGDWIQILLSGGPTTGMPLWNNAIARISPSAF